MTVGNYVRLFLGWLSPSLSGCCGQALCLEARPCPPDPPVPSTQVGPRVLLCWRAPSLPCVRYKILPAWLLGGENGIKFSLHAEQARNWAISGEQGEFCTGHAVRRGVRGEFCTGGARCGSCWESCVVLSHSLCAGWWAYGSALALLMGTAAGLSGPSAPSGALDTSWAGSLMGSALEGLRLHARKSSPCVAVRS